MNKKLKTALKVIGIYLAMNAFIFGAVYIIHWFSFSSIGHWLEIDKRTKPYVPGTLLILELFLLGLAIYYSRNKMRRD